MHYVQQHIYEILKGRRYANEAQSSASYYLRQLCEFISKYRIYFKNCLLDLGDHLLYLFINP